MLSRQHLIEAIISGHTFFARLPNGDYIARYIRNGPVEQVTGNGLKPLPLQGSDLCWHIQATAEESGE